MNATIPKPIVRALIRAVCQQMERDSYAEHMDAQFDGGEWSASMHGPDRASMQRVLDHLGLTLFEATTALERFARLDRSPMGCLEVAL